MGLILLVEDEIEVRKVIIEILKAKHVLLEAGNGEKGLDIIGKLHPSQPNLVILDMYLKDTGMSAMDFLMHLHNTQKKTPVLVISGYAEQELVSKALTAGATRFMAKPYPIDEFQNVIDELMGEIK